VKSCDDCPGSVKCTSVHLHPILVRVYDLYAGGMHDKFEILFSLSDADEQALELCNAQISRDCWTKAALWAIAEVVARIGTDQGMSGQGVPDDAEQQVYETVRTASAAFAPFPWSLAELVSQAPDLYDWIHQRCQTDELCERISKRSFMKACRDIAHARGGF